MSKWIYVIIQHPHVSIWTHILLFCMLKILKDSIEQWYVNPKGRRPFFGLFLDFGQAIVDAIFVQKISNFWWTCDLVLASRCTNLYKIPIFGYTNMPQKHFFLSSGQLRAAKKLISFNFFGLDFFHKFLTKFLNISSTQKSSKTHQIY
jgi:hypothetical protein